LSSPEAPHDRIGSAYLLQHVAGEAVAISRKGELAGPPEFVVLHRQAIEDRDAQRHSAESGG
jgi:hypothetical protein